jgi:hypothetical protein
VFLLSGKDSIFFANATEKGDKFASKQKKTAELLCSAVFLNYDLAIFIVQRELSIHHQLR